MDLAEFLPAVTELLAIRSTADRPAELRRALDFVLGFIGPGFTVERFDSGGKPSALLYAAGARPDFRVVFNGHLDVVPAASHMFAPRREGDRLYARGAHDMKVSALVMAQVFRELAASLPYPFGLQLVTDEEIGGRHGTKYQLDQGVTAGFVIIGEQSGLDLVTDSKGVAAVTLRATGRSGHGAYPWQGDNALIKLITSVSRLLEAYPQARAEAWRTTVNLARISTTNEANNQIPDLAEAWLDIRFPPDDADFTGQSTDEVAAYLAKFCDPGVVPLVERSDPPHHADQHSEEVSQLREAAQNAGYPGSFLRKHGAADGRFYYQRGTDAVIFGIAGAGLHGDEEYADLTSVAPYHQALSEFLRHLRNE
ncbi:MAG TPA: M20 family metallopeptidase [Streptosporangiaceae bacterium]|nr:M20 family metallopeptidase [Streptosporangiaceae bacterium]